MIISTINSFITGFITTKNRYIVNCKRFGDLKAENENFIFINKYCTVKKNNTYIKKNWVFLCVHVTFTNEVSPITPPPTYCYCCTTRMYSNVHISKIHTHTNYHVLKMLLYTLNATDLITNLLHVITSNITLSRCINIPTRVTSPPAV